jgi:hypothetical protein
MKNHPLFKKLQQIACDGNYTFEQVRNLDFNQVADLLGTRDFTITFLNNMKQGIINTQRCRDDEANLQKLQQQAKVFLDSNFPGWEAECGRQGHQPYITIWLEGKP